MPYLAPTDISDALEYLRQTDARVIAGCTDYFPSRGQGDVHAPLLDVSRLTGFRGITKDADGWRIGAATTWTDVIKAPLPAAFDALKAAAREVGSVQIQNRATLAGNICNASPAADGVPPLLALDASVETTSKTGTRHVPLSEFITGVRQVALGPQELVSAILVPDAACDGRSAFLKLGSRTHLVISIVMVAANLRQEAGRIAETRIAVGSCAPVAQRLPGLEATLLGKSAADVAAMAFDTLDVWGPLRPIDDVRGDATYRSEAAATLCHRAVLQALGEGGG